MLVLKALRKYIHAERKFNEKEKGYYNYINALMVLGVNRPQPQFQLNLYKNNIHIIIKFNYISDKKMARHIRYTNNKMDIELSIDWRSEQVYAISVTYNLINMDVIKLNNMLEQYDE